MNRKQIFRLFSIISIITAFAVISSCNKKFDEPELEYPDPNLPVTMTLKQLKAILTNTGQVREITEDKIISGIIVADDRSGNFYQSISIQDATGGVSLRIAGSNNFTSYPIGRRIYVKVKGLCVGDYGGMVQLGAISRTGTTITQIPIPTNLQDTYIVKGSFGNVITPRVISSINQLTTSLQDSIQNTLIQLNNFEFSVADTTRTYADPTLAASAVNLTIRNCANNTIILRTSSYANFAGIKVPSGNGSITAIYTFFNGTRQLLIRDTADVQFKNLRCGQAPPPPTTLINTADLRALYTGATTTAPTGRRITGIVISDRVAGNTQPNNIILQQGNNLSGIVVRFDAAHTFDLGDSVDVVVSGMELSEFSGTLQVNNVPLNYATRISTGKTITPRTTTVAQLNTNVEAWESTLVQINNITLSGGISGNWGANGNVTVNDGSGTVVHFTRSGASFQNTPYPTGTVTKIVGYVGQFNTTNQISMRNLNDIGTSSGGGGTGTGINLGSTSPFLLNFDNIGSGLPTGVSVALSATATSAGNAGTFTSTPGLWAATGAGFKNFASATGLTATATNTDQDNATNRALGVRQTSTTGYDPGAAFVFQLNNTTGKNNIALQFQLQSLDNTIGRTTTWVVDYALGDNPTSFTPATTTGTMTTSGTFTNNTINVNFGGALDNKNQKVWIRIVTLSATTGSGSRPSTAVDDFKITWN